MLGHTGLDCHPDQRAAGPWFAGALRSAAEPAETPFPTRVAAPMGEPAGFVAPSNVIAFSGPGRDNAREVVTWGCPGR
jgi:hypothetical protein